VVRLTFQPAWCGYTLGVTSKTLCSPEYITSKHTHTQKIKTMLHKAILIAAISKPISDKVMLYQESLIDRKLVVVLTCNELLFSKGTVNGN
jgi:hypothetical protein